VSPDYSAFDERPALSIPEVVITDHDEVSNYTVKKSIQSSIIELPHSKSSSIEN
jgi:hypothetical protein